MQRSYLPEADKGSNTEQTSNRQGKVRGTIWPRERIYLCLVGRISPLSFRHSVIQSVRHSFIFHFIHDSFMLSFQSACLSVSQPLSHSVIQSFVQSSILFINSFDHFSVLSLVHSVIRSFRQSCRHSVIQPLSLQSFIHAFIQSVSQPAGHPGSHSTIQPVLDLQLF